MPERRSENMVLLPSSSQWSSQNHQLVIDDLKVMNMGSSGINMGMEKIPQFSHQLQKSQQQQQQQQQQEPLRCPRCDSTNTKFCYYNNYSLSQPRHFCKACKRYWTRGGTLRNVPVGGGCRKNKRVKRPINSSSSSSPNLDANNGIHTSTLNHVNGSLSSPLNHLNPMLFGLPTNTSSHEMINLPFSRYDLEQNSQVSGLGFGISSGLSIMNINGDEYRTGLNSSKQIFQDLIFPSSLPSNHTTHFGSSNTNTTPSTISSILASKYNNFQGLFPYQEVQMKGNSHGSGMYEKDVKMEDGQSRSMDHWSASNDQTQMDQNNLNLSSSDTSVLWSGTSIGTWLDPSSMGSSVPSLI